MLYNITQEANVTSCDSNVEALGSSADLHGTRTMHVVSCIYAINVKQHSAV